MGRVGQHKKIPALLGEVGGRSSVSPWPNVSPLAHRHLRGNTDCFTPTWCSKTK